LVSGDLKGESYEITIISPETMPAPIEPIKTTMNVPGGILWTANAFVDNPSFLNKKTNKMALCLSIVTEIDKGHNGFFNNDYFLNCDKATPNLKQFEFFKTQFLKLWKQPEAPTEEMLIKQFGGQMRLYLRGIAFRWFSYYHMGYTLQFTEIVSKPSNTVEEAKEIAA
jgi:hypothetical protein